MNEEIFAITIALFLLGIVLGAILTLIYHQHLERKKILLEGTDAETIKKVEIMKTKI